MSADVYSMTIVIIELLTNQLPYSGMNQHQIRRAILAKERPSLNSLTEMSEEGKTLLKSGISSKPERRPSSTVMHRSWNTLTVSNQLGRLNLGENNNDIRITQAPFGFNM